MSSQRLQKILAQSGIASRRKAEEMIQMGLVTVNGQVAKLGDKAAWGQDAIKVNGKLITSKENLIYVAFNKPKAVISAMDDPEGRPAMAPYFTKIRERIYSIGRLDFNSEGLLLLTNDGELAEKIQKAEKIARVYLVKVKGHPDAEMLSRLERGGKVGERYFRPTSVRKYEEFNQKSLVQIVAVGSAAIDVRSYVESKGFLVEKITRQAIGHITLHGLEPGHYRLLQKSQLEALVAQPELGMRRLDQEGEKLDKRAARRASVEERLEAEGETSRRVSRQKRDTWGKPAKDEAEKPRPAAWASDEARSRRDAWKADAGKPLSREQGSRAWAKTQEDGGMDDVKFERSAASREEERDLETPTFKRDWNPSGRRKGSVGRGPRDNAETSERRPAFGARNRGHIDRPAFGGGAKRPRSYEDLYGEPGSKPAAPARRPRQGPSYTEQDGSDTPAHKRQGFKIHFGGGRGGKPAGGRGGYTRGEGPRSAGPRGEGRGGPRGESRGGFGGKPAGRTGSGDKPRASRFGAGKRTGTGGRAAGGRSGGVGGKPRSSGRPSGGKGPRSGGGAKRPRR